MTIDRSATARALAKAIAYKACGKDREAEAWAIHLVRLLGTASVLSEAAVARLRSELADVP